MSEKERDLYRYGEILGEINVCEKEILSILNRKEEFYNGLLKGSRIDKQGISYDVGNPVYTAVKVLIENYSEQMNNYVQKIKRLEEERKVIKEIIDLAELSVAENEFVYSRYVKRIHMIEIAFLLDIDERTIYHMRNRVVKKYALAKQRYII